MEAIVSALLGAAVAAVSGVLANWIKPRPWAEHHPRRVVAAFVGLAVVGALVAVGTSTAVSGGPTPSFPSASGATTSQAAPAIPQPDLRVISSQTAITSPPNNSPVDSSFDVSGTSNDDVDHHLWLFVYGPSGTTNGKFVYYRQSSLPLAVQDGKWSMAVGPLGEPSDAVGHPYIVKLVRADQSCDQIIRNVQANEYGEFFLADLPGGCKEVPPQLTVTKAHQ